MQVLVGMVADAGKNPQVGVARMVDEACRTRHEFAIHLQRRPSEPRIEWVGIGKLVEREKVHILALRYGGRVAPAVSLGRRDDLAEVAVHKLSLLKGLLCPYTCQRSAWGVWDGTDPSSTYPIHGHRSGKSAAGRCGHARLPGWDSQAHKSSLGGTRTAEPLSCVVWTWGGQPWRRACGRRTLSSEHGRLPRRHRCSRRYRYPRRAQQGIGSLQTDSWSNPRRRSRCENSHQRAWRRHQGHRCWWSGSRAGGPGRRHHS